MFRKVLFKTPLVKDASLRASEVSGEASALAFVRLKSLEGFRCLKVPSKYAPEASMA